MADAERTQQQERQHNGHDGRRTVVRAAALAAASGATALAAKKALSHDSGSSGERESRKRGQAGDSSMVTSMASSAWTSARDSLVPMMEDAAGQAGEWLAKNGPDLVRENIVPRFIDGFERAGKSSDD
jgi:hypothetical protein